MSSTSLGNFEQVMVPKNKQDKASPIPVRFVDDDIEPAVEKDGPDDEAVSAASTEGADAGDYTQQAESEPQADGADKPEPDYGTENFEELELDVASTPALAEFKEWMDEQSDSSTADSPSPSGEGAASEPGTAMAGPMLAELVATRAELRRVETERNDMLERLARRQADFENYRKRVERERGETYQRMVGDVVSKLLPVMDNMRRALEAESLMEKNESAEFRHFLRGVELIYKQLNDALEELGVEAVPSVGQPFDPHVHEAVATEHSDEYEPDIVTQELLRGYRLGEKLLRPAMVKVSTRQ